MLQIMGIGQSLSILPEDAIKVVLIHQVEVLGLAIRQNKDIIGFQIGDYTVKSGQFANDLWTVTPPSQNNVNSILKELQDYGKFSGLRINSEKSSVPRLGPFKDSDARFYTLKQLYWSPGPINLFLLLGKIDH